MSKDGQWIRIQGKAIFDATTDVKAFALEEAPALAKMYKSEEFEFFYIEEAKATFYGMKSEPRTIKP